MKPVPSPQSLHSLLARLRMKQLQLLIALDEHKSLHKAASALAMTQSAASKSLSELESILDAQLFERTRAGLVPNQFGHCVIRYARLMATDLGALCEEMAQLRSGRGGRLAVGAVMGAVPEILVPAVDRLQRGHPELSIEIVEDTSAHLLALLDEGHLDLLVARASVSDNPGKYHYQPLSEETLTVVAVLFVARGMLRILPVTLRSMSQTIGIVTRKGGELSRAGEAFVKLLKQPFADS